MYRLVWRYSFMYVVQQFDFIAQRFPALFKQFESAPDVGCRFEHGPLTQSLNPIAGTCAAVAFHSRYSDLHSHIAKSPFHESARAFDNLGIIVARRMRISIRGLTALSADQLIHRHSSLTAFDVPKCLIDAADCVIQDRTVLPI